MTSSSLNLLLKYMHFYSMKYWHLLDYISHQKKTELEWKFIKAKGNISIRNQSIIWDPWTYEWNEISVVSWIMFYTFFIDRIISEGVDKDGAMLGCSSIGAHLVRLSTIEKMTHLMSVIRSNPGVFSLFQFFILWCKIAYNYIFSINLIFYELERACIDDKRSCD